MSVMRKRFRNRKHEAFLGKLAEKLTAAFAALLEAGLIVEVAVEEQQLDALQRRARAEATYQALRLEQTCFPA